MVAGVKLRVLLGLMFGIGGWGHLSSRNLKGHHDFFSALSSNVGYHASSRFSPLAIPTLDPIILPW